MPLDQIPIVGRASEFTIPETRETLELQQQALIAGRRPVQMFPVGTPELPLPQEVSRIELPRGAFHFNPRQISEAMIASASDRGRENEILGLGPYCKQDVIDTGEQMVCIVERTPYLAEVLAAVTVPRFAGAVIAEMRANAAPGNAITIESPENVIRERLAGRRG